jgi:hypothetical protein
MIDEANDETERVTAPVQPTTSDALFEARLSAANSARGASDDLLRRLRRLSIARRAERALRSGRNTAEVDAGRAGPIDKRKKAPARARERR